MSATKTLSFVLRKNYRVWFEPVFKSMPRGQDHSRKLSWDSSFMINLNNPAIKQKHHEICTPQKHFIFYIWWLARKLSDLSRGRVTYSWMKLTEDCLRPCLPLAQVRENTAFTLLLGEKFSMQLSQQFLCYLWNRSCSWFSFLWAMLVAVDTRSQSVIQQVWQSTSQVFHSR